MKALHFLGKNELEVRDVEVPKPEKDEVLIRVRYAGICGTDLSIVAGKHPRAKPPLIMGHEFSGQVAETGSSSEDGRHTVLAPGQPVVVEPLISCGACVACRSGFPHVCQYLGLYGIDAPGAFAEYIKVPAEKVVPIANSMDLKLAALIEPLSVAVHAVRLSRVKVGDTVFVMGAGPIGMLIGLVARKAGAGEVLISETIPMRLKIAEQYGLQAVDSRNDDPLARIQEATAGAGADVVFEAAGAVETILLAPKACRVRGQIVQVAMPKDPRSMDVVTFTFREQAMTGVRVYAAFDFQKAASLANEIDLSPLVSDPFDLDQSSEAFGKAAAGTDVMRVVFRI